MDIQRSVQQKYFKRNPIGMFLSLSGLRSRGGDGGGGGLSRLGWLSFGRTGHLHGFQVLDSFSVSLLDLLQLGLESFFW